MEALIKRETAYGKAQTHKLIKEEAMKRLMLVLAVVVALVLSSISVFSGTILSAPLSRSSGTSLLMATHATKTTAMRNTNTSIGEDYGGQVRHVTLTMVVWGQQHADEDYVELLVRFSNFGPYDFYPAGSPYPMLTTFDDGLFQYEFDTTWWQINIYNRTINPFNTDVYCNWCVTYPALR